MKRFFVFLLMLALLCSLAGCTGAASTRTRSQDEPRSTEPITTQTPPTTLPPVTTAAPTEPLTEPAAQSEGFTEILGQADGMRYENQAFGFYLEVPSGWSVFSEEERAAVMGVALDYLGEKISSYFELFPIYVDFHARNQPDGSSIDISFEKMLFSGMYDNAEAYIEANLPSVKAMLVNAFQDMDITVEQATAEFLGQSVPVIQITQQYNAVTLYQKQVPVLYGDYVMIITVAGKGMDVPDALLACFSALD